MKVNYSYNPIVFTVSDWFGTKRKSVWIQINRKMVNTIWLRVDSIWFGKDFSVYSVAWSKWMLIIRIIRDIVAGHSRLAGTFRTKAVPKTHVSLSRNIGTWCPFLKPLSSILLWMIFSRSSVSTNYRPAWLQKRRLSLAQLYPVEIKVNGQNQTHDWPPTLSFPPLYPIISPPQSPHFPPTIPN